MKNGNRRRARRTIMRVYLRLHSKFNVPPYKFFNSLLERVRPRVQLTSKKIAGITYKIPAPISYRKSIITAIHWIINAASRRTGKSFHRLLFDEVEEIYLNSTNSVIKKRDEVHRTAYLNKPFLRYLRF